MKKKDITLDPKYYMTTIQARAKLPNGFDMSVFQKYRMRGSKKTYYLIEDINKAVSDNTQDEVQETAKKSIPEPPKEPEVLPELTLVVYVDGSYNKETGVYGSAAILIHDDEVLAQKSTNGCKMNSMWNIAGEIAAAALGVRMAEEYMPDHLIIRYDCEAIAKWPTGQWQIKNDFAHQYVKYMHRKRPFDISYEHVKAHTGDKYNEMADSLATKAAGMKPLSEVQLKLECIKEGIDAKALLKEYKVSRNCYLSIKEFYRNDKHSGNDYARIRAAGNDAFSEMYSIEDFSEVLTQSAIEYISNRFDAPRERNNALRWACRGLDADDAIKKAMDDRDRYQTQKSA